LDGKRWGWRLDTGLICRPNFYYTGHMDTLVDNLSQRLAQRIRLERDGRGWSLAELAERSGVSKATISKIERAEVSPTAVVLVRLASAFDLTLAGLMLRAESQGERVSRAADQPLWRDPETGYLRKQVFSRPDNPVEIIRVEMPARQRVTLPASSYTHIRQALWVLSGSLVITEAGTRHVLAAGDCLGFGPPAETTFANETASPCTYVVALARS
jgi:transcriptional regulator with XRE-family HTH domain